MDGVIVAMGLILMLPTRLTLAIKLVWETGLEAVVVSVHGTGPLLAADTSLLLLCTTGLAGSTFVMPVMVHSLAGVAFTVSVAATLLDGPLVLLTLVGICANPAVALLEAEGTSFAGPFGVDPVGAGFTELTEALAEVVALALLVVNALLVAERATGPLGEPVGAFLADVGVGFILADVGVGFTVALAADAALEAVALVDSEPLLEVEGAAETLALLLTLADAAALALPLVLAEAIDACLLDDVVVFAAVAVFLGALDTGPVCFVLPAADTAVDLPADVLELALVAEDTFAGVATAVVGLAFFSTAVD